jgi:hypothetical protein
LGGWFVGGLLITAGGLLVLVCGGCTLIFWIGALGSGSLDAAGPIMLLSGVLGGLPALVGVALIVLGVVTIRRWRSAPRPPPRVDETFR